MTEEKKNEMTLVQEGISITTQQLMSKPVGELTLQEALYVRSILDAIEKRVKARKEDVNTKMRAEAEAHGIVEDAEKGHKYVHLAEGCFYLQRSVSSSLDDQKLKDLLAEKKISLSDCYDEVKSLVLNDKKLEFLVQKQKLTAEEVKALHKSSYSLCIKAPSQVKALLSEAKKG